MILKKYSITLINLILYDLLLILTPFLLIQNYLQLALIDLSHIKLDLFFFELPLFVFIFSLIILSFIVFYRKKIRIKHAVITLFLIFLMFVGQNIADFYLDYSYYDLQNNWHYFAYGIFVFVAYRYFKDHLDDDSKLIRYIFFKAFFISTIDEGIQVFISNRIFDISDIAKDLWGVCLGLIVLLFCVKNYRLKDFEFFIKKFDKYFRNPINVVFILLLFSLVFLFISSNLTKVDYFIWIIIWTVIGFGTILVLLYLCSFKYIRFIISMSLIILATFFAYKMQLTRERILTQTNSIIYYNGFPLIFFDYMIYPNGMLRLVDKKTDFRGNDFKIIKKHDPEVLIISTDENPNEISGFEHSKFIEFPYVIYNNITDNLIQVLILKQEEALKAYNNLTKENKNVLLIIHNNI